MESDTCATPGVQSGSTDENGWLKFALVIVVIALILIVCYEIYKSRQKVKRRSIEIREEISKFAYEN